MTDRAIQLNSSNDHQADQNYFITRSVVLISILCVLPLLLMLIGFDFSTQYESLDPEWVYGLNKAELQEAAHSALRGSITHTLLEWTAFCAAIFVGMLAFIQFRLTREPSLPIIGMALVCAGAMDGFHTFAADRLIDTVADNRDLIPFTWAICRLFNGIILLVGVGIFAFSTRTITRLGNGMVLGICASFVLIAYIVIQKCAASGSLPQTMFPDSAIKRPYDIYPLIPYVLCGLVIFPKYLKRYPGVFGFTLMLALIPAISTQLYMALGSFRLHDSCFNIAHALKAISYLVPLTGLLVEFIFIHKERIQAQQKLQIQVIESTLLHGISTVASEAETVEEATQKCIDLICESIGWPIGQNVKMLMDSPDRQQHDQYLSTYLQTGKTGVIGTGREVTGRRQDGTKIPLDLSVSEMKLSDRRVFTGIVRDITERKESELSLRKTADDLQLRTVDLELARAEMKVVVDFVSSLNQTSEQKTYRDSLKCVMDHIEIPVSVIYALQKDETLACKCAIGMDTDITHTEKFSGDGLPAVAGNSVIKTMQCIVTGELRKVLIIEDDQDQAKLLTLNLMRSGIDVVVASNGQEGLECVERMMPDVIIITGHDVTEGRNYALEREMISLGAETLLTKPIDFDKLLILLRQYIMIPQNPVETPVDETQACSVIQSEEEMKAQERR